MSAIALSLPFGFLVAIAIWGLYIVFNSVPRENRQFRDRPALGFRIVWPLIQAVDFHFHHWMSKTRIEATLVKLKRAGVEYSLSAQFNFLFNFVVEPSRCISRILVSGAVATRGKRNPI